MATPTAIQSVTVTLRAGVTSATLPNNVKMRYGYNYVISLEDWAKLSRGVRDSIIAAPVFNTATYIVPGVTATGSPKVTSSYLLNLDTINNKSSIANINADAEAAKTYQLGDVVQGFNGAAFKLVKVDAGSTAIAAGDVVVWGGATTRPAAGKAAATVTGDFSDITDFTSPAETLQFAGVAIGTITAGNYGWIQTEGTVYSAKVAASVDAGESVYVSTTDETFASGKTNATQVITLTSFTGTDSFTITFSGQTTDPIVRGTNATAADVKTALVALTNLDTADISVTGTTDEGPYTVTFDEGGAYEGVAVPLMTITGTGCTGVSVTTVAGGVVAGTTVGTALTSADTGTANVELRSGLFANRHRKTSKLFLDKN